MCKDVSIKVCRLSRLSDMSREENLGPTDEQRRSANRFEVAEEAKKRSENRGSTVAG